ncbi:MAG: DUF3793 family protein [Erysipelotrichaceae bacterium]|nr:DUF3793 family protein [Erysipelotrichaceae bacterium]
MPLNGYLFQKQLIAHSACTLARMKTGSLFRLMKKEVPNYLECLHYFNDQCSPFGYEICILSQSSESLLIYVYHTQKLQTLLERPSIQNFLSAFGYTCQPCQQAIMHLRQRLNEQSSFPHEIGIFLGYPLKDVQAFIEHEKECLCIGYWKVYGNVKNTQKTFERFDCCTKTMKTKISQGEPLERILKKLN